MGVPRTGSFTLNADYSDADAAAGGRIVSVEWDFDADGNADQTDAVTDTTGSGSVSVVHNYAEGVYQPQVRFTDNDGLDSGWDKYNVPLFAPENLDVEDNDPTVTMEWWSPCFEILSACAVGSPDGRANQTFTLNATGSDDAGVTAYEWDFDADGGVDDTTAGGGSGSTTHSFAVGAHQPQVRTVDASNQRSGWDKKDIAFIPVDLDSDGPAISVNNPNPCFPIHPTCTAGSPDATTADVVAMSADYTDAFGVSVASVEWDFDGNGTVDDTTSVSGTTGTATTTHQYGTVGAYQIKARAIGNDGAIGQWNQWKILGLPADYDVGSLQIQAKMACWDPHDATVFICGAGPKDVRANYAVKLNADIDTCSLGVLCVGNYFTPTDQNDYDIEWRLGDASPSVIDSIGGATTPRSHNFPAGYPATGQYRPEVRLCDDAASSTNCSAWDRYDVTLVEQDLDVWAPCTGDADLDGVPCYFDPDSDTASYNHQLNYVKQAMIPGIILTNAQPDAALIAPLNLNRTLFFGAPIYWGGMNFINADIINPGGSYVNLKWSHFGMWANVGIGSSPDTGYVRGLSFCMGAKPGSLFGFAFGFCTYQASFDDDQQPLEVEDEVLFSSYINGYGATDYEGFTLPLVSPEIQVSVNP